MAEVDPFDPHTDEHDGEDEGETSFGGHDNTGFDPDDYHTDKERRIKQVAIDKLKSLGIQPPNDLYYGYTRDINGEFVVVSEDKVDWYRVEVGYVNGERTIGLIPPPGRGPPPDTLKRKLGLETSHEVEMTIGPAEYLNKVFDNPNLDGISYGIDADSRVWVSLSRVNAIKYYIRDGGTAENASGREVDLPKGLRSNLGKTCVEAMKERGEKIKSNRAREEYLSKLQEMGQVNIELRERNEEIERERVDLNKESKDKDDVIASLRGKIQKDETHFEQLGIEIAKPKEREEYHKETIKNLTERLEGALSPGEKARITAELQMMSRENQTNIQNVNEKQTQLNQAARDIAQQKERIGELEMQREEMQARITELEREVERNVAQVDRNESDIGDQGDVEEERLELERENEQLEERNEEVFARLSLKEKVKWIFSKYGFNVIGILAAVGVIIGVIVSNLKTGLGKVATGVGNGLKEIGKKAWSDYSRNRWRHCVIRV